LDKEIITTSNSRRTKRNERRFSVEFFNQVRGYTPQTDIRFTGLRASLTHSKGN
jgi:hypothetical protein